MIRIVVLFFFLLVSLVSFGQSDTISTGQASKYIGKEVLLVGKVVGFKNYVSKQGKAMVFLDLDESYPNNPVGITIFEEVLNQLKLKESEIFNHKICIRGIVELYKEKPSIVLKREQDLTVF
jgi:hypothetical protein